MNSTTTSDATTTAASDPRVCELQTEDQRRLFARRWGGSDSERVFVVVHGLGEHGGCYDGFARYASENNCATLAYDQHGHGLSPGRRGTVPEFQTFLDDLAVAMRAAEENWPGVPRVILAHSMGGNVALKYLLDARSDVVSDETSRDDSAAVIEWAVPEKMVCINPMIMPPQSPTRPQVFAAWLTGKLIPNLRLSSSIDPKRLTTNPEAIEAMAHDPMLHQHMTLQVGTQLVSHGQWLLDHATDLRDPLMILLGGDDDMTDQQSTREFAQRAGQHCKLQTFDGLRHNLLQETKKEEVFESIVKFCV